MVILSIFFTKRFSLSVWKLIKKIQFIPNNCYKRIINLNYFKIILNIFIHTFY